MLLFNLALFAVCQGQVHVVDAADGPGTDFTELAPAVLAAAEGDVILVRAGDYLGLAGPLLEGIHLDGKGIIVVADQGASVNTQSIVVQNLPASSQVLIQGLGFVSSPYDARLDANLGPLWFERCNFGPAPCGCTIENEVAMHATDCAAIVLARCSVTSTSNLYLEATAILAENSRLHAFDSVIQGVSFGETEQLAAITLRDASFLELLGSNVNGGRGDDSFNPFVCDGDSGGDAVSLEGLSTFVTLDSVVEAGEGGDPFTPDCSPGAPGNDIVNLGGNVIALGGSARSLDIPSPVRTNEIVRVVLRGLPGDRVWLKYSFATGTGISSRFYDGENMLGPQRFRAVTTRLPASGVRIVAHSAPQLAAGQESLVVYLQAFFLDAAGSRFVISSPCALVLLDESF